MKTIDAIIIGAGVLGSSVALGLSRRGLKTLNIDALPAAGYGSTSYSSAVIRPFYSAIESCALAYEARNAWLDWPKFLGREDDAGMVRYIESGMLILLAKGEQDTHKPALTAMDAVGVPYEIWDRSKLTTQLPGLSIQSFAPPKLPDDEAFGLPNKDDLDGGIFVPHAGYVTDPQLAAQNIMTAAKALGAIFRFNTRVEEIVINNGRVAGVKVDRDEIIYAPIVVNVAGPHSGKINEMACVLEDMAITTRPMRHEVAHVPAPSDFKEGKRAPVVGDADTGVYFRAEVGDSLLIGSIDPKCDAPDWADADDYNAELTDQWRAQVWRAATRIPTLGIPNTATGIVGLYDTTPDWIPIYDKSSLPGFYMAIGTSGNQFKNAPMIGPLMAELITRVEGGQDHDKDPVFLHLDWLDREISLGFFSRLRDTHTETSGTVLA